MFTVIRDDTDKKIAYIQHNTYLCGDLTESPRVEGLLLRWDEGTTGSIVQVKDKVLDGVGKHFVGHGWGLFFLEGEIEMEAADRRSKKIGKISKKLSHSQEGQ